MPEAFGAGASLWVAMAVGAAFSAFLIVARLRYLSLPPVRAANGSDPDCMVVIPARDEAPVIARAVRGFPPDSVIVVDDGSTDGTAEVARKAGAGVIKAPDPARGATGKANACAAGARALDSKWILFADADVEVEREFLRSAAAFADANGLAMVSFYLDPVSDSAAGALVLPLAVALYFCGVNPRGNVPAGFNGQCVLARRDAYEFIGGHGAILAGRIDDVKLAALALRHRLKIGTARAPRLGRVRFRELSRTIERGASRFTLLSQLGGAAIVATAIALALWAPVLAWLLIGRLWMVAMAFTLLPIALLWNWYRSWRALLAPAAIYLALPMIARGFLTAVAGRRLQWKGRTI